MLSALPVLVLASGCSSGRDEGAQPPLGEASQALLSSPVLRAAVARSTSYLQSLRGSFGLDTAHNFVPRSAVSDELGQTHIRLDQTYRGLRIFEGEAIVALAGENEPHGLISELRSGIDLPTQPTLSGSDALGIVRSELNPQGDYAREPAVELMIFPRVVESERAQRLRGPQGELNAEDVERKVRGYALAYHVHTELENGAAETQHTDFMVDAHSGEILKRWSTLHTAASKGTGKSQYSGSTELGTDSATSGFELRDVARAMNITTYNLNHGTSGTGTVFADADNTWGDGKNYVSGGSTTGDNGQTAGVDAHFGTEKTFDYYQAVHGRNGIDGAGKATYNRVHYSSNYDNAFWSDGCFCMTYGDGRSLTVLTSLDVAGHEMTHGVTSRTANLTYSGESGGLNEAMSDIMGAAAESWVASGGGMGGNPATWTTSANTWKIGEDVAGLLFASIGALRLMNDPTKDNMSKDYYPERNMPGSADNGGVHTNSGIGNLAYYLATMGGKHPRAKTSVEVKGIGIDKATRIFYLADTMLFTDKTTFQEARYATAKAAELLYGRCSTEWLTMHHAWDAVAVPGDWQPCVRPRPPRF